MTWPNDAGWRALAEGDRFEQDGKLIVLSVVDCGELVMPVGRLVACDPFTGLAQEGNAYVSVPPGRYPVKVTLADVSGQADGSHLREAYATVLLSEVAEVTRRPLTLLDEGEEARSLEEGEYLGFGVDAGTACFVDDGALASGMPDEDSWYEEIFDGSEDDGWFNRMDDPEHIRAGIANVPLPLADEGANIVLMRSGWGDGVYPAVGGYDAAGETASD